VNLRGKTALITGSSKGIGKVIAYKLAELGVDIILHYFMNEELCLAVKKSIQSTFNVNVMIVQANLADKKEITAMFAKISQEKKQIDILINNAASGVHRSLETIRKKDWDWTLNVNGSGALFCIQEAIPLMDKYGGYIINITSMGSERYIPEYGAVGSSKAILENLTRYFSIELADKGIVVNTIVGGVVETEALQSFPSGEKIIREGKERTPAGRLTKPEDIANIVKFLVSGDADMIRGQKIVVDGGLSLL
jgi:enoyl-[acyl-carrier protein] reductase III